MLYFYLYLLLSGKKIHFFRHSWYKEYMGSTNFHLFDIIWTNLVKKSKFLYGKYHTNYKKKYSAGINLKFTDSQKLKSPKISYGEYHTKHKKVTRYYKKKNFKFEPFTTNPTTTEYNTNWTH